MTKSFKEYLLESKQNYEFKIKIAGETDESASGKIKAALEKFKVESLSSGKRTPIQETQVDFPEHSNINVTVFDLSLAYPTTSNQVRDNVASALNLTHSCVKVRNLKEQEEEEINNQYCPNHPSGEAVLGTDYEKTDHQDLVGEQQKMSLLKELGKTKHQGTQYKGINDDLLAGKVPTTKTEKSKSEQKSFSTVGSHQNKLPDPYKGK
jgi:hypothetical protein